MTKRVESNINFNVYSFPYDAPKGGELLHSQFSPSPLSFRNGIPECGTTTAVHTQRLVLDDFAREVWLLLLV